jgi:predicted MFS family arabinose efflux permease
MSTTAPPSPPEETTVPVMAILLLSFAAFASGLSLRVTDPLLPALASEFGVSLGDASYVVTLFSVAYGTSLLFYGPLGDRYGKYRVVGWACFASAITAALCAVAPTYETMLIARFVAGATTSAAIPLSMAWIGDVIPYSKRQPVIARFLVGQILGLSAGVLLGGLAADHLGRHIPFYGLSLAFLLTGIAIARLYPQLPAAGRLTQHAEGHVVQRMIGEFGAVLKQPWARVVLLSVCLEGGFLYGSFAFIASHLHTVFGLSLSSAGLIVMLFGGGGLVFAGSAQWVVKRFGEAGMGRWGGVLMAITLMTVALAPSWVWAIPACFVCGIGFYMLHNTLQTNATQMAPERRGAAVAAFATAFYFGQSIGVGLAGLLVAWAGTRWLIAAGAVGVLIAAFNFARLRSQRG